jgi:nitroreductase
MEGLLEVIKKRRAYRAISDRAVDEDVQKRILTAGTYAPSCFNRQP